jgi:DNA polymerase III delta subunit
VRIIKEADFRKEIKNKPECGYLFFGEEDYMKSFALSTAVQAISPDPSFSFFNEIKLDSFSYSPEALLDALMPLPMMADRKIITLSGVDFNAMRAGELDKLCEVLSKLDEYDYNTLIINTSADRFDPGFLPKRPSSALQKLTEYVTAVNFEKNTPAKLAAWVGKHFEHNGVSASPEVCAKVIERCGRDMFNLASETDKLAFYVKSQGRDAVKLGDVEYIAIPAVEYDGFALTNAIAARRKDEAINILKDLIQRRADPIFIMGEITKTVCDMLSIALLAEDGYTLAEISDIMKIHEYRVSVILKNRIKADTCKYMISKCRKADLDIKNSASSYAVIEELICSI